MSASVVLVLRRNCHENLAMVQSGMEIPESLDHYQADWIVGLIGSTIDRKLNTCYGIQPCRYNEPEGPEPFLTVGDELPTIGRALQEVFERTTARLRYVSEGPAENKVREKGLEYARTFLQSQYDNAVAEEYDYRPCWDGPDRRWVARIEPHWARVQSLGFLCGLMPAVLDSFERSVERHRS